MSVSSETTTVGRRRVSLKVELQRFRLPPIDSALIIGRRAAIGPTAMAKSLEEMVPHEFERVDVEHPRIQTILVHTAHLRRIPKERLVEVLVQQAEDMIDETEMLHVTLDVSVSISEEFEL